VRILNHIFWQMVQKNEEFLNGFRRNTSKEGQTEKNLNFDFQGQLLNPYPLIPLT